MTAYKLSIFIHSPGNSHEIASYHFTRKKPAEASGKAALRAFLRTDPHLSIPVNGKPELDKKGHPRVNFYGSHGDFLMGFSYKVEKLELRETVVPGYHFEKFMGAW